MYNKLKQLLLEGITTGGDPYKTGYRIASASKLRKRKGGDSNFLATARILSRMFKRNDKKGLSDRDQINMINQYSLGIERGGKIRNRRN